jgi:hypothetical protein
MTTWRLRCLRWQTDIDRKVSILTVTDRRLKDKVPFHRERQTTTDRLPFFHLDRRRQRFFRSYSFRQTTQSGFRSSIDRDRQTKTERLPFLQWQKDGDREISFLPYRQTTTETPPFLRWQTDIDWEISYHTVTDRRWQRDFRSSIDRQTTTERLLNF